MNNYDGSGQANNMAGYDKRGRNTKGSNMFNHLNQQQQVSAYSKTQNQAGPNHARTKTHLIANNQGGLVNNNVFRHSLISSENN